MNTVSSTASHSVLGEFFFFFVLIPGFTKRSLTKKKLSQDYRERRLGPEQKPERFELVDAFI